MQDDKTPQAGWVFTPGDKSAGQEPDLPEVAPQAPELVDTEPSPGKKVPEGAKVSWSASEYIANPKNAGWFSLLALSSFLFAVIVYITTKDITSTVVIVILGIIIGVFAARQPRVLEYHIDEGGLHIGNKYYSYANFKSFSLVEEGVFAHVSLMPLKRFMPPIAIHFSPKDEDKIVKTLADYLPYEEHKADIIDNVTRRLRF